MHANVLVVHASEFGSTRGIAEKIAHHLADGGLTVTVASAASAPDPTLYDGVIIGSAVHAGHWLADGTDYVRRHRFGLAQRPVWLFSSGPLGDRAARAPQPDPKELDEFRRAIGPLDHVVFGGSFDRASAPFDHLGFVERTVVRRFLPDGDWRDWSAIQRWAGTIAHALERRTVAAI
jgi:menaquinone-dependent protoporphyrinogen oxidase